MKTLPKALAKGTVATLAAGAMAMTSAVNTRNNDWRRGWGNDYRGYNDRYSGYDSGKFKCEVRYGRVTDLDYSGIRGL